MFDQILDRLGLSNKEFDEAFDEFQKTAADSYGPVETLEAWNNNKTKEQREAFAKGMIYSFFLRKAAGSVKEEIEFR